MTKPAMFARPAGKFQASRQAKPSRLVASWVNKFCLAYLKQCVEILCMAAGKPCAGYFGCGKPWAGCFGRGKTLGGLFWLRKNLGGRYFGAEKTMRVCTFWKFDTQTLYF